MAEFFIREDAENDFTGISHEARVYVIFGDLCAVEYSRIVVDIMVQPVMQT